jgi:hypothetical protein
MSKHCEHCGKELADECEFCDSCGTLQTGAADAPRGLLRVKFTAPKIIFCVIAVAALVGLFLLGRDLNRDIYEGGGFESALDNVVAVSNGKVSRTKSLAPREYWERLAIESDFVIDEYIAGIESEAEESRKAAESSTEEETSGAETEKAIKYSYKIIDSERVNNDMRSKLDEKVRIICGTDEKLVTDAYSVNCCITAGDGETGDTVERHLYIVRIRDNWYPLLGGNFMFKPEK